MFVCSIFSLPSGDVLPYNEYKPVLVYFGLIDSIQKLLKVMYHKREKL